MCFKLIRHKGNFTKRRVVVHFSLLLPGEYWKKVKHRKMNVERLHWQRLFHLLLSHNHMGLRTCHSHYCGIWPLNKCCPETGYSDN